MELTRSKQIILEIRHRPRKLTSIQIKKERNKKTNKLERNKNKSLKHLKSTCRGIRHWSENPIAFISP